jgi:hypothetical protein
MSNHSAKEGSLPTAILGSDGSILCLIHVVDVCMDSIEVSRRSKYCSRQPSYV